MIVTDKDILDWLDAQAEIYESTIEIERHAPLSVSIAGSVREVIARQIAHEREAARVAEVNELLTRRITVLDTWSVVDVHDRIVTQGWPSREKAREHIESSVKYGEHLPLRMMRELLVEDA